MARGDTRGTGAKRGRMRDRVREQAKDAAGGKKKDYIKLPEGMDYLAVAKAETRHFDVVPYEVQAANHPYFEKGQLADKRVYYVHKDVGVMNETVVCPAKTFVAGR